MLKVYEYEKYDTYVHINRKTFITHGKKRKPAKGEIANRISEAFRGWQHPVTVQVGKESGQVISVFLKGVKRYYKEAGKCLDICRETEQRFVCNKLGS